MEFFYRDLDAYSVRESEYSGANQPYRRFRGGGKCVSGKKTPKFTGNKTAARTADDKGGTHG
jgi:hypothetical protein